ncbi:MAG TPA: MFS transporter, partial [Mycobacterium sp.]|nr:MFS transporter [Mycobacterium sp.]
FGDRLGRKAVLVVALLTMGLVTTAIGLLPTYADAGLLAPALLAALRVLQGLAVGAEWGGAAVLSVEHAPPGRRGLFGSFTQLGSPAGMLLATSVFYLTRKACGDAAFLSFGWRIPFLLSAILVAIGLFIRLRLTDAAVFGRLKQRDELVRLPVLEVLRSQPRNVLITTGLRMSQIALFVLLTTYSLTYLQDSFGKGSGVGLIAVLISSALGLVSTPGWALLSDRFGRRPPYMFGALAGVVALVLFFVAAASGSAIAVVLAIVFGVNVVHDAMYGPQAAWFAELFDTRVRYSGSSLGYQIGAVLSGGFAPLIAAALLVAGGGRPWLIVGYFAVLTAITVAAAYAARETYADQIE